MTFNNPKGMICHKTVTNLITLKPFNCVQTNKIKLFKIKLPVHYSLKKSYIYIYIYIYIYMYRERERERERERGGFGTK